MKKYEITFYDKDVTSYTMIKYKIHDRNYVPYISNKDKVIIRYFVDKKLLEDVKKFKRNFSNAFKKWFIRMKANYDKGLTIHGNVDDWWWVPAMRLRNPGIQIKGIDY